MNRTINALTGDEHGALLIVIGQMHGNEPAGTQALERVFAAIANEYAQHADFKVKGRLVGVVGNRLAAEKGVRFINFDLNRSWTNDNIALAKQERPHYSLPEWAELDELAQLVETEIATYQPSKTVILDIHTTSASGGIYAIPQDWDAESIALSTQLKVPVILKILDGVLGTALHYFNASNPAWPHRNTYSMAFECGQHTEPESVDNATSGIINCMRSLGMIAGSHVEQKHDDLLARLSKDLPPLTTIIYRHAITDADEFVMRPGYLNFQAVKKGEVLAHDRKGEVLCPEDGYILMPLYQKQGSDGFFLLV